MANDIQKKKNNYKKTLFIVFTVCCLCGSLDCETFDGNKSIPIPSFFKFEKSALTIPANGHPCSTSALQISSRVSVCTCMYVYYKYIR